MTKSISRQPTVRLGVPYQIQLAMIAAAVLSLGGGKTLSAGEPPTKTTKIESSRKSVPKRGVTGPVIRLIPNPPRHSNLDIPPEPYNGFFPDPNAPEESKDLQQNIAEVLSRLSTPYPARVAHFAWLANDPYFQKYGIRMAGWGGVILEAKKLPDNGWIAKARVRPQTVAVGRSVVHDYVDEVYRYHNGKLTLIETDANNAKPDKQIFALH